MNDENDIQGEPTSEITDFSIAPSDDGEETNTEPTSETECQICCINCGGLKMTLLAITGKQLSLNCQSCGKLFYFKFKEDQEVKTKEVRKAVNYCG